MRAPVNLEICAVICSLVADIIPESGVVVVAGSVVAGCKVVAVLERGLVVVVGPGETTTGGGVSPARGPGVSLLPGEVRGMSVRRVSQVSEAEPGFREIGDASL